MEASQAPTHTASASGSVTGKQTHEEHHSHHRVKKSADPFLTRSLTAEVGDQFRQPARNRDEEHDNSLLADLIVTPLTMISFIFSLVLVDRQQRQWRLSQHSPETTAGWSRAWLGPEPYQASPNPRQANESNASQKGNDNAYSGWYTRKKKRAIARMEISDALEMRKRIVFALFVWSALVLWGAAYVLRCTYGWIVGT